MSKRDLPQAKDLRGLFAQNPINIEEWSDYIHKGWTDYILEEESNMLKHDLYGNIVRVTSAPSFNCPCRLEVRFPSGMTPARDTQEEQLRAALKDYAQVVGVDFSRGLHGFNRALSRFALPAWKDAIAGRGSLDKPYDCLQDVLAAAGYTENGGAFTKGDKKILFEDLAGYTPTTLAARLKREAQED